MTCSVASFSGQIALIVSAATTAPAVLAAPAARAALFVRIGPVEPLALMIVAE
jgi:hypothetical protein